LRALTENSQTTLYTFHDALRVHMVGQEFLNLIWQKQQRLDSLVPGSLSQTPNSPSRQRWSRPENVARAINCINQTTEILDIFGVRYDYIVLRNKFEEESAAVLGNLYSQQRNLQNILYKNVQEATELDAALRREWDSIGAFVLPGMTFGLDGVQSGFTGGTASNLNLQSG